MNEPSPNPSMPLSVEHVVSVSLSDRWQVCHRLQELDIPCACLPDGTIRVIVNSPLAGIQLWSVVYQVKSSRSTLVHWLGQCWQA